jgi:hypothetical protein
MIKNSTKKEVFERDKEKCVLTGTKNIERTPHHAFHKSEYFGKDRDESWNLITIGLEPHRLIHFASNDEEVIIGKKYNKICRQIAFDRYKGENKNKLIEVVRARYGSQWRRK